LHKYAAAEELTAAEKSAALTISVRVLEMWQWQYGGYQAGMLSIDELPIGVWRLMYRGQSEIPIPLKDVWTRRRTVMDLNFAQFMDEHVANITE
jgi:hypothetical protein